MEHWRALGYWGESVSIPWAGVSPSPTPPGVCWAGQHVAVPGRLPRSLTPPGRPARGESRLIFPVAAGRSPRADVCRVVSLGLLPLGMLLALG